MSEPLHLIKLCVGAESAEDQRAWQAARMKEQRARGVKRPAPRHVTRMWPRRAGEILATGGSLYWVIKGLVLLRQRIAGFDEVIGADGIRRCGIRFDPELVAVSARPRGPFQGWRYLSAKDAPPDIAPGAEAAADMPRELQRALSDLGVL